MKLLFLLPTAVALCCAAGLLMIRSRPLTQGDLGIDFNAPRHLVTPQMELETSAMKNRRVSEMKGSSELGKPIQFAPGDAAHAQFVLFIKDGCPCSIDAQPLFNRLSRRYKGQVGFVGVIDGDRTHARNFAQQFTVEFPVVADPDERVIKDFEAKAGVYSALIARNGHIVKMWPGYSADILKEMNHLLAQEAGVKETPFDPQYAPIKKAAGCAYNW